jgi:hypothetical protein
VGRDAFESGIVKPSSMWGHSPPPLESIPERLCSAVLVVAMDLALDVGFGFGFGFGFGLLAPGTYVTNFVESGGPTNEVVLKKVILS